ncbi:MAG: helix-turn-helix transcriptional regulator [Spirochaetes bacterium]|nr:helix-turn-helix transcriptional regulator [Spirochaetota bacterium]
MRTFILILLAVAPAVLVAREVSAPLRVDSLDVRTSLAGEWRVRLADDRRFAAPGFDDSVWETVRLPNTLMKYASVKTGKTSGILWLRKAVYIGPNLPRKDIGLILGRIANADETYFNGEKIGGMGEFPPHEHSMWNHPRHYTVPVSLIRYGGVNVIAVRLSYFNYGEIVGSLALTNLDDWKLSKTLSEFFLIILAYVIIAMGVPLFMIFFFFYIGRRESQEYLFYILQLLAGLFIIVDLCTPFDIYGGIVNRFKFLGISWVALNTFHPIFLHRIYDLQRNKTEVLLWTHLAVVFVFGVFFTNEETLQSNGLLMILVTTQIGLYNMSCHISALMKKRPYAKVFSFFGIVTIIGAMHDGYVYLIKFAFADPDTLGPLFQVMAFYAGTFPFYLGTSLVLVIRIFRMMDEVEDLNTSMETFIIENALLQEQLKESNGNRKKAQYPVITDRAEEKIQQVVEYINKNYTCDLSREGLAATVNVHPDNLGKLFKMHTSKKMGDYINELRVKDAARRLAQTDESIIDIAFSVGFDSLRTFNRVFPKFMKVTPEKYRKIIRKV